MFLALERVAAGDAHAAQNRFAGMHGLPQRLLRPSQVIGQRRRSHRRAQPNQHP